MCCTRAYANSWYTQFSYPSLFTSTMPLDHGGYDLGIATRPASLPEVLRRQGLRSVGFSTDPYLNAYYGYDRGFDEFFELFDLARLLEHVWRDYLARYHQRVAEGSLTREEAFRRVGPMLQRVLDYAEGYLARKRSPAELGLHRIGSALYRQHQKINAGQIARGRRRLALDPKGYIEEKLERAARAYTRPVRPERKPPLRSRKEVSAHDVVSLALRWIERRQGEPFFAWLCLNDVHDRGLARRRRGESESRRERRARRGATAAVHAVDEALGALLSGLGSQGLLDSTVLALCADHGLPENGDPTLEASFSDQLIRVPIIFSGPGVPATRMRRPCSLIDVAPTLLDLMGLPPERGFRGTSIVSGGERPHVVVEQLGGGPCDLDLSLRAPTVCVIDDGAKLAVRPDGTAWWIDLTRTPRAGFVPVDPADIPDPVKPLLATVKRRHRELRRQVLPGRRPSRCAG